MNKKILKDLAFYAFFLLLSSFSCFSQTENANDSIFFDPMVEFERAATDAYSFINARQYRKGIEEFEKSVAIAEKKYGHDTIIIYYYHYCFFLCSISRDYLLASAYIDKASALSKELNLGQEHNLVLTTEYLLAQVLMNIQQYSQADTILHNLLSKSDSTDSHHFYLTSVSLGALWKIYDKTGNYSQAEETLLRLCNLTREQCKPPNLWGCHLHHYCDLGEYYQKLGRYKDAEDIYRYCLENMEDVGNNKFQPLIGLGCLLRDSERFDEAEEILIKSLKCLLMDSSASYLDIIESDSKGGRELGRVLNALSKLFIMKGKYQDAEKALKRSISYRYNDDNTPRYEVARSRVNLAFLYISCKRYDEADSLIELAKQETENDIGSFNNDYFDIVRNEAILHTFNNKPEKALACFKKLLDFDYYLIKSTAFSQAEEQRKKLISKLYSDFELFYSFSLKYNEQVPEIICTLYDYILKIKGFQFNTARKINERILSSGDSSLISKFKYWKLLREYAMNLRTKPDIDFKNKSNVCDSLDNLVLLLEKFLSQASTAFTDDYVSIDWKQIRNALKPNEAAIEIIRINNFSLLPHPFDKSLSTLRFSDSISYVAMVIRKDSKDSPDFISLPNSNEFETRTIYTYRNLMSDYKKNPKNDNLYAELWQPIEKHLDGITTVYLSNDGIYHQINTSTLYNPHKKLYVFDYLNTRLLSGTKELLNIVKHEYFLSHNSRKRIVLFGYPDYGLNSAEYQRIIEKNKYRRFKDDIVLRSVRNTKDLERLPALPASEIEVEKTLELFKKMDWNAESFTGAMAIEEAVKAVKSPDILHISTHGSYLEEIKVNQDYSYLTSNNTKLYDNPMLRSMLFFAGAKNNFIQNNINIDRDDGLLTAYEAMSLHLDSTQLVVLSACETGVGDIINGEGVYCLQRAFHLAGAKTVIMSLWKIPDEATKDIIICFYENLLSGKTANEALRTAQSANKKKYPHPLFWGGLVLSGK